MPLRSVFETGLRHPARKSSTYCSSSLLGSRCSDKLFEAEGKFPFLIEWRRKLNIDCMMKYESYQLVYSAIHSY